ncbi:hypothetical protein [Legionella spiritensis]|uniref:Uncharacterized protein n=1 Tax=Legionella spiritensis TaxID=452 RepID=A0A0W0ZAE2_LEGSP|nr:hypothetical protein [Legionella spiritensis]KTD65750.1 hypothetical protein Lspi_0462 [Legionella spiritensis]SNV42726.1 Uncharacterised protein [Legionella spiritensis]
MKRFALAAMAGLMTLFLYACDSAEKKAEDNAATTVEQSNGQPAQPGQPATQPGSNSATPAGNNAVQDNSQPE